MKNIILIVSTIIIASTYLSAQESSTENELAIKEVLIKCYVEGIHINRDTVAVKKGFHENFIMHVYVNGQIVNASLDMWLGRLQLDGIKNTNLIESTFELVDVSGNSAIVRMEILENSKHMYTDYFGLYEFTDGWKIVNKIFYSH